MSDGVIKTYAPQFKKPEPSAHEYHAITSPPKIIRHGNKEIISRNSDRVGSLGLRGCVAQG